MNSCGATPRVKYIYEDLKDGLAIIQVHRLKLHIGSLNSFYFDVFILNADIQPWTIGWSYSVSTLIIVHMKLSGSCVTIWNH